MLKETLIFYGWWQFSVCLFSFAGLMAIWWHLGRKQQDNGQVWLALSILCWSVLGAVEVFYAGKGNSEMIYFWRSILSLMNSYLILAALPWFRYLPGPLEKTIKDPKWSILVGAPLLLVAIVLVLMFTLQNVEAGNVTKLLSSLDTTYSLPTLAFLGFVLFESFAKRRLKYLAILSLVCIATTLIGQLYKLFDKPANELLLSAIFKTNFIMIFFALALSWIKELAENIIPDSKRLFLHFNIIRHNPDKVDYVVEIQGLLGRGREEIMLSQTHFQLFHTFAERKIAGGSSAWLEVKPRNESRSSKSYDIRDHNEIKRLLHSLLDAIFGKGNWTKDLQEQNLKQAIFQYSAKRERKIQLAIPAENISFTKPVLSTSDT